MRFRRAHARTKGCVHNIHYNSRTFLGVRVVQRIRQKRQNRRHVLSIQNLNFNSMGTQYVQRCGRLHLESTEDGTLSRCRCRRRHGGRRRRLGGLGWSVHGGAYGLHVFRVIKNKRQPGLATPRIPLTACLTSFVWMLWATASASGADNPWRRRNANVLAPCPEAGKAW